MKTLKTSFCIALFLLSFKIFSQDLASYNFTTGSPNDISGNNNHGTLYGNSTSGDTLVIGANITDYFQIPATVLNGRLEFSLFFKIKFNSLNIIGNYPTNHLFSGDTQNQEGNFAMSYQKSTNEWLFVNQNNVYHYTDATIVSNRWYCVCFTRTPSGAMRLYVNGVENSANYINSVPLYMTSLIAGQETDCFGSCFAADQSSNAKFDFIKMSEGAMPLDEINAKCSVAPTITTGLNTLSQNDLEVFPNPAVNAVFVSHADNISSIALVSIDGKLIRQQDYDHENVITIPTQELASGIYFLQISSGKLSTTRKIIKE